MTDKDLLYAATALCWCDAGMAHPLDHDLALTLRAWVCSAVLKIGVQEEKHNMLPFALFKVREETSINNIGGRTTRPLGTVALTQGKATCPICKSMWESEPYSACGANHHWFPGSCPSCGHAVGGNGTWRSSDGPRIETRYSTVVLETL